MLQPFGYEKHVEKRNVLRVLARERRANGLLFKQGFDLQNFEPFLYLS